MAMIETSLLNLHQDETVVVSRQLLKVYKGVSTTTTWFLDAWSPGWHHSVLKKSWQEGYSCASLCFYISHNLFMMSYCGPWSVQLTSFRHFVLVHLHISRAHNMMSVVNCYATLVRITVATLWIWLVRCWSMQTRWWQTVELPEASRKETVMATKH